MDSTGGLEPAPEPMRSISGPLGSLGSNLGRSDEDIDSSNIPAMVWAWLALLRRRWILASGCAVLMMVPFVGYAVCAIPEYQSEGVLQVAQEGGAGLGSMLQLLGEDSGTKIETEVEILRRKDFLLGTLHELGLQVEDRHAPNRLTLDTQISLGGQSVTPPWLVRLREVSKLRLHPGALANVDLELQAVAPDRVRVSFLGENAPPPFEVAVGEERLHQGVSARFSSLPVPVGTSVEIRLLTDGAVLERLGSRLLVTPLKDGHKSTDLVTVRFTHHDRQLAQIFVDALMERYLRQSLDWQTEGASKAASFIKQRLEEAEAELRETEDDLREFSEQEHAVQLDTQAQVTIENVANLQAQVREIEVRESVIGNVLSSLKQKARKGGAAHLTSSFLDDPVLGSSIAALTDAETRYETLRATLTDDHPQVRDLGHVLQRQRLEVSKLLATTRRDVQTQKRELEKQLSAASESLELFPNKHLQLARLMRDVEVSQKLYSFLLERHREAEILQASTTVDKRIVDTASLPYRMSAPKRTRIVATGLIAAALAAVAGAYLANLLQKRLGTVEEIQRELRMPVYGTLPLVGGARDRSQRIRIPHEQIWSAGHTAAAEAFRALCVSLSMIPVRTHGGRVIAVTSSQPREGKSMVVANLAICLRKTGASVAVVDLDLRKPVQHREWRLPRSPGYTDAVAKTASGSALTSMMREIELWGVDVLTAGSKLPDTLAALMTHQLPQMISELRQKYDYVLLDSAPAFVSDSAVVARLADFLLLVARPGVVERGTLRNALSVLRHVDGRKGLVLNGVQRQHSESYYYYGQYSYAAGYGDNAKEAEEDPADHEPGGESSDDEVSRTSERNRRAAS